MAVSYTATIDGYDYGFDFSDQRIDIDDEITRLNVESLYRAIQDAQSSVVGIAFPVIATASGLDQLAEGITTFITVKLLESWEINTLLVTGKFEVAGGNLIREDNEDPFRDNPLITYINYISQAGVRATYSTGSGLSDEQNAKLNSIPSSTLETDERIQLLAIATLAELLPYLTKLSEIHKIQGLDASNPMTVTTSARTAGDINLAISGNGTTTTTVTRQ
jgi:hypothetical protein